MNPNIYNPFNPRSTVSRFNTLQTEKTWYCHHLYNFINHSGKMVELFSSKDIGFFC